VTSSPGASPDRILITGANGHLGRQLVARLGSDGTSGGAPAVRALVRSERAAAQVRAVPVGRPPEIVVADYADEAAMARAVADCGTIVHLVGIIKESGAATYEAAHERTCTVLARVAGDAAVRRIVYLGIVGSTPGSSNPCLASKARAEEILLAGRAPATILRVPMVLGPEDHASAALRGQARARVIALVGGGRTLQQPVDSADVVEAVLAAGALADDAREALDLGGPECLTHRELVMRAAALYGSRPRIVPIPLPLARAAVALLERALPDPPVTRAMFDILQHDDRVDEAKCCERLGLRLTPLDETLRRYVGPEAPAR
jgi:NADH dehydrogenase